jgi:hypothetical protein
MFYGGSMGIEVVLLAAAAGTTAYSAYEQREAGKEQKRASERQFAASQRKAEIENVRSMREAVRRERLAKAQMENTGYQVGAAGGSALAGGVSSIAIQSASNINYMAQIAQQNTAMGEAQLAAAQASADAAMWGAVGQISGTIFSGMGGVKGVVNYAKTGKVTA